MLNRLFEYILISTGSFEITVGQLMALGMLILVSSLFWRLTKAKWRIDFFEKYEIDNSNRRRFERHCRQLILLVAGLFTIRLLKLDFELFNTNTDGGSDGIIIRYSILLVALIILVGAWLLEWFFSNILISKYEKDRIDGSIKEPDQNLQKVRVKITKLVQYIVVTVAAIAIINKFGWDFEMFNYKGENNIPHQFTPNRILIIVLIFLIAQMIVWVLTQVVLYGLYKNRNLDQGTQFAINQLLKYVVFSAAVIVAIQSLGVDMTLILGGAAALLVGIGLGLQQTFNDFFSGLVLLFERSVSVGDIMDVGGEVGAVKKIGLRSSIIETRGNVSIIVPNSKLVNDSVKNWSHFVDHGRFQVDIGVAYGSDTALVKKLLLTVVSEHRSILDYPVPFVRFNQFADSSLNFSVYFFSDRFMIIEDLKSDIRFEIDAVFREHNIQIPFPQRDVWMRNGD